jgi:hypothetical protein
MSLRNVLGGVLLCGALISCTPTPPGESTPTRVLETYIKVSFGARDLEDKKKMEELLTGDTRKRLAAWSDEQFNKAFVESKKRFLGLKVIESKKVSEEEVALTYELSFQEGSPEKAANITQKKLCAVIREGEVWRIKEVRSIRESIEYLNEFSLP